MNEKHKTAILMIVVPLFRNVSKEEMKKCEADLMTQVDAILADGYKCFVTDEYKRGRRDGMKDGLEFRKRIEAAA